MFASSVFDEGFAVQDATAGIFASFPSTDIGVQPPRDVEVLAVGQLIEVTGFSSQFTGHYEIDIRGPEDLAQPVK